MHPCRAGRLLHVVPPLAGKIAAKCVVACGLRTPFNLVPGNSQHHPPNTSCLDCSIAKTFIAISSHSFPVTPFRDPRISWISSPKWAQLCPSSKYTTHPPTIMNFLLTIATSDPHPPRRHLSSSLPRPNIRPPPHLAPISFPLQPIPPSRSTLDPDDVAAPSHHRPPCEVRSAVRVETG